MAAASGTRPGTVAVIQSQGEKKALSSMVALNIKDKAVADKARRLARLKGKNITAAVSEALDEGLHSEIRKTAVDRETRERLVDAIVKRFRKSPRRGALSPWKVLDEMYNERGLPR